MRNLLFILMGVFLVLFPRFENVYAFEKGGQECTKCHTLDAEQAREVLKALIPDVKVLSVQESPVKGFWEIGMESGGKKGLLYVDFSKKKLFTGNIFGIQTKINFTQESFSKLNKVDLASFPYENSIVMGDKDAKIKVVVFDDPD